MTREAILHIENLHKSFSGNDVLKGISFSLFKGENLVVLGKSGTGKSVIMKCIVKLMEPDKGSINVFGTDVLNCSEKELAHIRNRIGYLFQEGAMYDSMTVKENLLFPANRNPKFKKMNESDLNELVEYNLQNVGLLGAMDKYPSELSGGMKKRAGLARTLMLSPDLIIYDEPTTGLDPYTTKSINELILQVREKYNTSAIIITHDIKCARSTSDRILIMHDGTIIAEGSFDELAEDPIDEIRLFFN